MYRRRTLVLVFGVALAALSGCGGGGKSRKAVITNRPQWDFERYERIAVLPGRASTPDGAAVAQRLADQLETRLANGGQFKVLNRSELQQVFMEQDLSRLADSIDEGSAIPEGRIEVAQAVVAVRLTDYRPKKQRIEEEHPVFRQDPRGRMLLDRSGRPIVAGVQREYVYVHGAEVEARLRVIDAATGKILVSDTIRPEPEEERRRGRPPEESPEELAARMCEGIAAKFFQKISPTQVRVDLKTSMLIVATGYFDGRFDEAKRISPDAGELLIAVAGLPQACDGNDFLVAVSAEAGRENIYEKGFTWTRGIGREGLQFRIPLDTLLAKGGERFVAKLYAKGDPEPKLVKPFLVAADKK